MTTRPLRIVLAEDHALVRAGLRSLLQDEPGMEVVGEASDGSEAVARAAELRPDVLVVDVSMPGMDGAEATERVRAQCPEVKVLALTMHEDWSHVSRLLAAGANGYVLKRAAAADLVRAIEAVAAGATYVDPALGSMLVKGAGLNPQPDVDEPSLSGREEDVLRRIAWGQSNKQIAAELAISTKTVETYKARITQKLGLRGRTDVVRYAVKRGWLQQ